MGPQTDEDALEVDDFLSCDEDLSKKMSPSSVRRRKYAVVQRDVIREEEEYSDSSMISEADL